ncbi:MULTISPECIES: hypothetical protein [unclassified Streptomyces]|uniref:hypothetical protein n=1 Tax=unclassified Streptomyces TaxID=2593676 RepID=UPI0038234EAE
MGVYLVSIDRREWFGEEEGGHAAVASALDGVLRGRGLPPFEPFASEDPPGWFEEKMAPPMTGFDGLCRAHLAPPEQDALLGWTTLVPLSLDTPVTLPLGSAYDDETVIAGAPQALAAARRLAGAIGLPLDAIPATGGNLGLTLWFLEGDARRTAPTRPGPWTDDLDTAFYVAVHLRAAEYSLRHGRPMTYS